jgi:hypothetical protein
MGCKQTREATLTTSLGLFKEDAGSQVSYPAESDLNASTNNQEVPSATQRSASTLRKTNPFHVPNKISLPFQDPLHFKTSQKGITVNKYQNLERHQMISLTEELKAPSGSDWTAPNAEYNKPQRIPDQSKIQFPKYLDNDSDESTDAEQESTSLRISTLRDRLDTMDNFHLSSSMWDDKSPADVNGITIANLHNEPPMAVPQDEYSDTENSGNDPYGERTERKESPSVSKQLPSEQNNVAVQFQLRLVKHAAIYMPDNTTFAELSKFAGEIFGISNFVMAVTFPRSLAISEKHLQSSLAELGLTYKVTIVCSLTSSLIDATANNEDLYIEEEKDSPHATPYHRQTLSITDHRTDDSPRKEPTSWNTRGRRNSDPQGKISPMFLCCIVNSYDLTNPKTEIERINARLMVGIYVSIEVVLLLRKNPALALKEIRPRIATKYKSEDFGSLVKRAFSKLKGLDVDTVVGRSSCTWLAFRKQPHRINRHITKAEKLFQSDDPWDLASIYSSGKVTVLYRHQRTLKSRPNNRLLVLNQCPLFSVEISEYKAFWARECLLRENIKPIVNYSPDDFHCHALSFRRKR